MAKQCFCLGSALVYSNEIIYRCCACSNRMLVLEGVHSRMPSNLFPYSLVPSACPWIGGILVSYSRMSGEGNEPWKYALLKQADFPIRSPSGREISFLLPLAVLSVQVCMCVRACERMCKCRMLH